MTPRINRRNCYRLLHVQQDAPLEIIKASYRTLMQKLRQHPDLGGDDYNAALLNEAYAVLTNSANRKIYDRQSGLNRANRKSKRSEARTKIVDFYENDPEKDSKKDHPESNRQRKCIFCKLTLPIESQNHSESSCPHCHSPLKSTATPDLDSVCKRVLQRTNYHTPLEFLVDWPQARPYVGTIHDLSPIGMGFSSIHRLSLDQLISVSCAGLQAVARVTHCQPGSYRNRFDTGIQFITLQISQPQGRFVSELV